jgi:hypothetical protein
MSNPKDEFYHLYRTAMGTVVFTKIHNSQKEYWVVNLNSNAFLGVSADPLQYDPLKHIISCPILERKTLSSKKYAEKVWELMMDDGWEIPSNESLIDSALDSVKRMDDLQIQNSKNSTIPGAVAIGKNANAPSAGIAIGSPPSSSFKVDGDGNITIENKHGEIAIVSFEDLLSIQQMKDDIAELKGAEHE